MNIDNDYDNDGNNIVPCPICLSVHCPSKEDGKCPGEDEFVKAMPHQPSKSNESLIEEFSNWDIHQNGCSYRKMGKWIVVPCDMNCKNVFEGKMSIIITAKNQEREKAVEEERERIVKIAEGMKVLYNTSDKYYTEHGGPNFAEQYNQALTDLIATLTPNISNNK